MPGRTNKPQLHATHNEQHAELLFELLLFESELPKPFSSRSFQKIQVRAVINDFAGVSVLKIHPDGDRKRDLSSPATVRRLLRLLEHAAQNVDRWLRSQCGPSVCAANRLAV